MEGGFLAQRAVVEEGIDENHVSCLKHLELPSKAKPPSIAPTEI